jgi:WD40 repeat protein/serine/threonine protein kinase
VSCPTDEELTALLEGRAPPAERLAIGRHVASCEGCRRLLGELGQTDGDPLSDLLVGRSTSEYVLASPLGSGGMGVVYRASDLQLGRTVAVKLLSPPADPGEAVSSTPDVALSDFVEARFMREALITARLQHPSIIPVYQGGRWSTGEPFYAMRIVGGRSFRDVVADAQSLNERLALLPHLIAVAEAIAYAHSEGVIHRDLKPDNVLIGPFGETVVVDWGLAKDMRVAADDEVRVVGAPDRTTSDQTLGGTVLGTPAYMPPEQANGSPVDERADVYALGALLYFMIAGVSPYGGEVPADVVRQVIAGPPRRLLSYDKRTPDDLLAIVDKAMARDRSHRYRNGTELASDLKLLQAGQLVAATRYSTLALTKRWMNRHRAPLLTAAALLSVLVVMLIVGVRRIVADKRAAQARGDRLVLANARAALLRDPTAAIAWLKAYPRNAADWLDAHGIALEAASLGVARHVFRRDQSFASGDYSDDGSSFVSAGPNRTIVITRLSDGRPTAALNDAGDAFQIRFAGADKVVFVNLGDPALHLWRIGETLSTALRGHADIIRALAISSHDKAVATGSDDGTVRLWDLAAKSSRELIRHSGRVTGVRFSEDGHRVFSAGYDGAVRFAELQTGKVGLLVDQRVALTALAASADDRVLACSTVDGSIRWVDLETKAEGSYRAHEGSAVNDVDVSHDGRFIASAGENNTVVLYDREARHSLTLVGHTQPVDSVSFSSALGLLASAARDGNIVLWRLDGTVRQVLRGHAFTTHAHFSADGTSIASLSADKTTRVWSVGPEGSEVLPAGSDHILKVVFAPDGSSLATSTRDGTIRVWTGNHSRMLSDHSVEAYALTYSGDGRWLISGGLDGAVRAWELSSGAERLLAERCGSISTLTAERNSSRIAAASADGRIRIFDLATGDVQLRDGHHGAVRRVAVSAQGDLLASASSDGTIELWNSAGEVLRVLSGHRGQVINLEFAPDGQTLASTGTDRTVRIWQVRDGSSRLLAAPAFFLIPLHFSPDGKWLAAAGQGDVVRLWQLPLGTTFDLAGHTDQILRLAFSPDGALLATASFDHTVRVWSLQTKLPVAILPHNSCVMDCAFEPSGARLATVTADHVLKLWSRPFDRGVPTSPDALGAWLEEQTTAGIDAREQPSTPVPRLNLSGTGADDRR